MNRKQFRERTKTWEEKISAAYDCLSDINSDNCYCTSSGKKFLDYPSASVLARWYLWYFKRVKYCITSVLWLNYFAININKSLH